ncbi:hypothetical protein [Mangrovicoccus algicola]|uniref:Uncharacterized protein n=1 Tax=Mangrovicoccus algicola TaxID=2771008 RepID=A0A8J6YQQ7_9RHOB|nr:hypothetical protein [Mangrovicoccus algicola]MBE3637818.1 hypothetical protein [Mangrovicoccus algicola]
MNDAVFRETLTSSKDLGEASLATKILVANLRREVSGQPALLDQAVSSLSAYFAKHQFASKDLAAL